MDSFNYTTEVALPKEAMIGTKKTVFGACELGPIGLQMTCKLDERSLEAPHALSELS